MTDGPGASTRTPSFVAVADDDRLALGLAAAAPTLDFAGRATGSADLPALLASTRADVAVVAVDDDARTAEAIRIAADMAAPPTIVAVMDDIDGGRAIDALAAGATALVPRTSTPDDVAASVWAALTGAVVVPPAIRPQLVRTALPAALPALSTDEQRLLQLLVGGLDNAEIAATVFASIRTVKRMLHVLYGKLGVRGRTEAALLGVRAGIAAPDR